MKLLLANLTNGGLSGGYRKYLRKILPLLQKHPAVDELTVLVPPQSEIVRELGGVPVAPWPSGDQRRGFEWVKDRVKRLTPDVVFIPTARSAYFPRMPIVSMIRNMEPLRVPVGGNPFGEVIKNFGRAHSAKKASIDADRIIAVSGHVKEFLTNKWGLRPEKIGVVYHGVDIPTAPYHSSAFLNLECIVDRRFIFTAGSIRPARGLEDLLSAFGLVLDAVPGIKLVIAGSIDPGMGAYKSRLEKILKRSGVVSSVVWTGALTDMQMSWCYHNCSVFVMTSRAEACPNVVLEAMSHGCISVSTDTDPMPEFYADTALYYSAADHVMLAKAIQSALALDKSQRMERSANSKSRAALFSWDVCVNRTIQELVEAVKIFHGSYKE